MSMMQKLSAVVVLVALGLVTGCGGSDNSDNSDDSAYIDPGPQPFRYSGTLYGVWHGSAGGSDASFTLIIDKDGYAHGIVTLPDGYILSLTGTAYSGGILAMNVTGGSVDNFIMGGELHSLNGVVSSGSGTWVERQFNLSGIWHSN